MTTETKATGHGGEFKTAAEAAAAWWAEQVGAPVFRNVGEHDSPEDRRIGGMAGMLASMLASSHPVTSEQGEKFVAALAPKIEEMLGLINWVSLGVDYGPDLNLAEAAKDAGIDTSRFPWKTHMSITRDYVTASLGYGAQARLIWSAPDWERPPCHMQHYIETDDFEPRNELCSLPRFHDGDHGEWIPDPNRCSECGGTYVDHFGRDKGPWTHSWNPAVPS